MSFRNAMLRVLAVCAVLFAMGCPPSIQRFDVVPAEVCPNGRVTVSWAAHADRVTVTTDPMGTTSIPAGLSVPESGETTITATRDFDVILTAFRSGQVAQRRSVHVVNEARPYTIAGPTMCRDGMLIVTASAPSDPLIGSMQSWTVTTGPSFRPLTVQHAGMTATFPPAGPESFRGTPVSGAWVITAPLLVGESCGSTGTVRDVPPNAPPTLTLIVNATCGGAAPQPRETHGGNQGNVGQPCFPDRSCYSNLQCRIGDAVCIDPSNPPPAAASVRCNGEPATAQTHAFTVGLEDANGCGANVTVLADSAAEAEQCAPRTLAFPTTVASGTLEYHAFCKTSSLGTDTVYFAGFSPEAARRCAEATNPGATIADGACP
jgi:hypothetical protein